MVSLTPSFGGSKVVRIEDWRTGYGCTIFDVVCVLSFDLYEANWYRCFPMYGDKWASLMYWLGDAKEFLADPTVIHTDPKVIEIIKVLYFYGKKLLNGKIPLQGGNRDHYLSLYLDDAMRWVGCEWEKLK